MPRHDKRAAVQTILIYEPELVFRVLLAELNVLREDMALPVLTEEQMEVRLRQYLIDHPRPAGA